MAEFGVGLAANAVASKIAGPIIGLVIQKMTDIIKMGKNVRHLKTRLTSMKGYLRHIENEFQQQRKELPEPVHNCLKRMRDALQEVKDLINRSEPQPRCLGFCFLRDPRLSTQIKDWETRFEDLFKELERGLTICANTTQIAAAAAPQARMRRRLIPKRKPHQAKVLRQPIRERRQPQGKLAQIVPAAALQAEVLPQPFPNSFVLTNIGAAQRQVQGWLGETHPQARMVGIYGKRGVGKRSLLRLVYNHFKEVRGNFDVIIWLTISRHHEIEKLQSSIADTLGLKLEGNFDSDTRKMKLSKSLEKKKFLLIMNDLWRPIDLINEVGIKFGDHRCSKVLMSSSSRKVIFGLEATEKYTMEYCQKSQTTMWKCRYKCGAQKR